MPPSVQNLAAVLPTTEPEQTAPLQAALQIDGAVVPFLRPPTPRELQLARQIQRSLLPKAFPSVAGFGITGFCRTAGQVGGDMFDVLVAPDHSVVIAIADVMGKGVPAALFATILRSVIRLVAETTTASAQMLSRINSLIADELSAVDMFITAQLAVLDPCSRQLTLANAGHCPLLVKDNLGRVCPLSPPGIPLGISTSYQYAQETLPLDHVRSLLLYSDGLTEAQNANGEPFGQERLENWFRDAERNASAALLQKSLIASMQSFAGASPPNDDQTFVLVAPEPMPGRPPSAPSPSL